MESPARWVRRAFCMLWVCVRTMWVIVRSRRRRRIKLSRESGFLENQVEQMGEVFLQVAPIHNQIHESFLHQEF